eukprot:TRINITY_DN2566_c1_g2_i1.p1 TRINITY_DN2566_c1_g2~~TRINITY_DN2566_c1_g2_i1.p1  ORF type:complete len:227 (+),score=40.42 TRINITY_DN2566_c1_g2_i1:48-683(+)
MSDSNPLFPTKPDAVVSGSALVAVCGLAVLPIEPFTGLTLLAAGLGVGGVKIQGDKEKAKEVSNVQATMQADLDKVTQSLEKTQQEANQLGTTTSELKQQNAALKWAVIGSAAASAAYVGYRLYRHSQKEKVRIGTCTVVIDHHTPASYSPRLANHHGDSHCICCMENIPDLVLKPCMHMQLCWVCLHKLPKAECPTCRAVFSSVDFVFSY